MASFQASYSIFVFVILAILVSCSKAQDTRISEHPVVIIISFDGFRYDYMDKTDTPNLDKVKKSGVSVPYMQNEFLTYTFPNHHSIATGLHIESHGIIANSFYDPLYDRVLSGYDDAPGFWNYSSSILPLYTVNELAGEGRHSGVMMWTGSGEPWGEKKTYATHLVKYNDSIPFEERVDTVVDWITDEEKPANLVFLYFEEPDKTGHSYGPEGDEIIVQIQRMDNITGYLMEQLADLEILDKVNLIFLSDHGMQEIKPNQFALFKDVIPGGNNVKYVSQGIGSPFLQINPVVPSETLEIFEAFNNSAKANHYTAYLKEEVSKSHPHWHYANNRRVMPIFLVAEVGYVFEGYASKPYSTGAHGFDNQERNMRPYFMAQGPLFKNDGSVQKVFNNVDICPLICHIMKINPPPNNGSLEIIGQLLLNAPGSAMQTLGSTTWEANYCISYNTLYEKNYYEFWKHIIGVLMGTVIIAVVLGFLIFKHRQKRRRTMNMDRNQYDPLD